MDQWLAPFKIWPVDAGRVAQPDDIWTIGRLLIELIVCPMTSLAFLPELGQSAVTVIRLTSSHTPSR